jgi:hypothetical protein
MGKQTIPILLGVAAIAAVLFVIRLVVGGWPF